MLLGIGDGGRGRGDGCEGCGAREKRRRKALRALEAAHDAGALGELAGLGGLEDLDPNTLFPDRSDIDREELAFDERVNAWMVDYQAGFAKIPKSVAQQVDDWIGRWREFHASWYVVAHTRVSSILAFQSEWNRIADQVAAYGAVSSVQAATVQVDGKTVRADQIPPGSSTLERIESLAKWGALLVGGVVAYKVASDLGVVAKIGGLLKGSSGGGGGGRRWGSAKL